ncbi:MAG: acyltransferase [Bacteroidia bacterium]|nr:acyltransferase [Bacteroidia bacterium]
MVYRLLFRAGKGLHVMHNVFIDREHRKFDGSIRIGSKVLISHDTHIDYTGHLIIEDRVRIAAGVNILTHARDLNALRKRNEDVNNQSLLVIRKNVYIGTNSIILASCHYIGENAIVAAGSVVTKDVPDNVMVAGVPAKFVKNIE